MSFWTRPADVPFPSVWHRFERTSPDGTVRKFYVQDATEEMDVFLIDHMQKFFARDEVLSKAAGVSNDPKSLDALAKKWNAALKQRITLVCFEAEPDGSEKPFRFAGCFLLTVVSRGDPETKPSPDEVRYKIYLAIHYALSMKDPFELFHIDSYVYDAGLCVVPDFRGMGISAELGRARMKLSKAIGVKMNISATTGIHSQSAAVRIGFKDLVVKTYEEIERAIPICHFPGLTVKSLRIMYKESE